MLVLIPAIIGLTIYFSWYYFSGQDEKDKTAEKQKVARDEKKQHVTEMRANLVDETRRVERNASALSP